MVYFCFGAGPDGPLAKFIFNDMLLLGIWTQKEVSMSHYSWRGGEKHGAAGEIPYLKLDEEDPLPPLDLVSRIIVKWADRERLVEADLRLIWNTDTDVYLLLEAKANDARLKEEYKRCPEQGKKIVDAITEASRRFDPSRGKVSLELGGTLPSEKVPTALQPIVGRVVGWQAFLKEKEGLFFQRYCTQVSSDGYYVVPIAGHALVGPWNTEKENLEDDWKSYAYPSQVFDPAGQIPIVQDEAIFWRLEEQKLMIVLFHEGATDEIAAHYGYADNLALFKARKAEEREKEKRATKEFSERYSELEREDKEKLTKSLLGG